MNLSLFLFAVSLFLFVVALVLIHYIKEAIYLLRAENNLLRERVRLMDELAVILATRVSELETILATDDGVFQEIQALMDAPPVDNPWL